MADSRGQWAGGSGAELAWVLAVGYSLAPCSVRRRRHQDSGAPPRPHHTADTTAATGCWTQASKSFKTERTFPHATARGARSPAAHRQKHRALEDTATRQQDHRDEEERYSIALNMQIPRGSLGTERGEAFRFVQCGTQESRSQGSFSRLVTVPAVELVLGPPSV